jgi:serine/threonine protein kinase
LHSLDPPIIHRDIKPENILLDADGAVKLADFGWSNFFQDDSQKRQTYCGTPEYLAPEMIKQKGHDKSLDIWNLGVLLFELLTGSPPFEGSNQSILFENILGHKVKWPSRFNPLAKDLIQRLLKINPQERIKLDDISQHAWFKNN